MVTPLQGPKQIKYWVSLIILALVLFTHVYHVWKILFDPNKGRQQHKIAAEAPTQIVSFFSYAQNWHVYDDDVMKVASF
jgi:hypothetical protein